MGTRVRFFKHYLFWLFAIGYLASLYFKFYKPSDSFLNNQFADLLCMPIVFYIASNLISLIKKDSFFRLSKLQVFVGFLYFSVLFEVILPNYNSKYTGDWFDVLMYGLGSLIYYMIQSMSIKKAHKNAPIKNKF